MIDYLSDPEVTELELAETAMRALERLSLTAEIFTQLLDIQKMMKSFLRFIVAPQALVVVKGTMQER